MSDENLLKWSVRVHWQVCNQFFQISVKSQLLFLNSSVKRGRSVCQLESANREMNNVLCQRSRVTEGRITVLTGCAGGQKWRGLQDVRRARRPGLSAPFRTHFWKADTFMKSEGHEMSTRGPAWCRGLRSSSRTAPRVSSARCPSLEARLPQACWAAVESVPGSFRTMVFWYARSVVVILRELLN